MGIELSTFRLRQYRQHFCFMPQKLCQKHNPNRVPQATLDNWRPVWNAQVFISTPVCIDFELCTGSGDIHICWLNFYAPAQENACKPQRKCWDEITHQFPNFNGLTVEVWEWINDLNGCNYLSMLGFKLIHLSNGGSRFTKHDIMVTLTSTTGFAYIFSCIRYTEVISNQTWQVLEFRVIESKLKLQPTMISRCKYLSSLLYWQNNHINLRNSLWPSDVIWRHRYGAT